MILEAAFSELRSTEVATIHCSGLITPENVLQKLQQVFYYIRYVLIFSMKIFARWSWNA